MNEIPESIIIARQLSEVLLNQTITDVTVMYYPNKFTFLNKPIEDYTKILLHQTLKEVKTIGSRIVMVFKECELHFWEGTNIRVFDEDSLVPKKHQLYLVFNHRKHLIVSIVLYGFIELYQAMDEPSSYLITATEKPHPLNDEFSREYFEALIQKSTQTSLSVKALLATNQNIPGFGNGILQDVCFEAHINPKRKVNTLHPFEFDNLYWAIKNVLKSMVSKNGRDTEKDVFGNYGNYPTIANRNKQNLNCPRCQGILFKEAYMGGGIYYCKDCQK